MPEAERYIPLESGDGSPLTPPPEPAAPPEPPPEPAAAPAEPAQAAPVAPEPEDDSDLDAVAVEDALSKQKFVALDAARAERGKRKKLAERVAALESDAERAIQAAQYWKQQADTLTAQQQAQPPYQPPPQSPVVQPAPAQADEYTQDELHEYARDYDLYRPDGTPDTDRARRGLRRIDAIATRRAEARIRPVQEQAALHQSRANKAEILNALQARGIPIDRQMLDGLWQHLESASGGAITADRRAALVSIEAAIGHAVLFGQPQQPPPQAAPVARTQAPAPPVVVTEGTGRPAAPEYRLSASEKRTARELGLTERQWAEKYGNREPFGPLE